MARTDLFTHGAGVPGILAGVVVVIATLLA
jgi:hypothetical protein